jgi:hypothetical protein
VLSNFCCVDGKARANGLIADSIYRMNLSLQALGDKQDPYSYLVNILTIEGQAVIQ